MKKLYLYITQHGLQVMSDQPTKFNNDLLGQSEFIVWLNQQTAPISLWLDVAFESFQYETIPALSARDYRLWLGRKLAQCFPDDALSTAIRADSHVVLSGFTHNAWLKIWLDLLQDYPIHGIHSLAQLAPTILPDTTSAHTLCISWQMDAGLRQSYCASRQLRFSRLTPVSQGYSAAVLQELPRTLAYLQSLHVTKLTVLLVGELAELNYLRDQLPKQSGITYQLHYLKNKTPDATSMWWKQAWQTQNSPNYVQPLKQRAFKFWLGMRWLQQGAILSLAMAVVWLAGTSWQAQQLQQQHEQQALTHTQLQQQLKQLSNVPVAGEDYEALSQIQYRLNQYQYKPEHVLQPLSEVLNQFPEVELTQLGWHVEQGKLVLQLEARLDALGNQHRAVLNYFSRFEQALQTHYQVEVTRKPLDLSNQATVGSHTEVQNPFALTLVSLSSVKK